MTTIEDNKKLACRWLELVSEHDVEALCGLTADEWILQGGPPGLIAGPAGVRELFRTMGPVEQTWTIEDVIAEGDRVVVRASNSCTQDSFFGVPSHGRVQRFSATFTFQIADGKVLRTWRNADDLGRLLQLGARLLPAA
jgi:hypothetical protein